MLSIFQNRITGYITGLVLLVLLFIPDFLKPPEHIEYSNQLFWQLLHTDSWSAAWRSGAAMLLIAGQAFMLDALLSVRNIYEKNTGLPFILFILFYAGHPALHTFSPALASQTLLLLGLWNLLEMYQRKKVMFAAFNSGIITTLASLFWLPAIGFHLFNIIACAIIRPLNYKDVTAFLIGGLLPLLYIVCAYTALPFPFHYYPELIVIHPRESFAGLRFSPAIWGYAAWIFMLVNIALLHTFRAFSRLKIISRRFFTIAIIIPLFVLAGIALAESPAGSHFAMAGIPFTLLMSQLLLDTRDQRPLKIGLVLYLLILIWLQTDWYFDISFALIPQAL